MSTPVFLPPIAPSPGMKNKPELKIRRADFGDGYTMASPDGLNNIRAVYDMSWDVLLTEEADEIIAFLAARKGTQPFLFTVPGTSSQVQFTCESWSDQTNAAGLKAVSATFRQSFNP